MNLSITIPTSLNEITLEQYQKFLSIAKDNKDTTFLNHKMIEIFCGVSLMEVSLMKMKDISEIIARLEETFKANNDKLIRTFKQNGVEYGFIPNLDEITLGEYTDLDTYISDWDNMHKAMAVLYRPITKKVLNNYLIKEYNGSHEYSELMKSMPLDVALSSTVFFFQFTSRIVDIYSELFGEGQGISGFTKEAQFGVKWGWYSSYYALAKGNVLEFENVSKLRLTTAFTYLTFEKEKLELERIK